MSAIWNDIGNVTRKKHAYTVTTAKIRRLHITVDPCVGTAQTEKH